MKLVVGLGNPGPLYSRTRHNLGFMVVDQLAADAGVQRFRRALNALVADHTRSQGEGDRVILLKPQTFMNLSGQSIAVALRHYRLAPTDLAVIYDDLDLELGRVRLRAGGSSGGHRGVESVIASLGTQDFFRVRLGIGRPPEGVDAAHYVLQPFSPEEADAVTSMISRASEAVRMACAQGWEPAMRRYSG